LTWESGIERSLAEQSGQIDRFVQLEWLLWPFSMAMAGGAACGLAVKFPLKYFVNTRKTTIFVIKR